MKTTNRPQKMIVANEVGQDSFSVDGKILTKSEVEMLCALMPDSQLVWVKYFTKKKPWEK